MENFFLPGMVVYTCNLVPWRLRQEDSYVVRLYL